LDLVLQHSNRELFKRFNMFSNSMKLLGMCSIEY
jgi:hypothetical protein